MPSPQIFSEGRGWLYAGYNDKGYSLEYFFFKFKYANEGGKDNKVKPYMVCQIKKDGSIQINRVSSKVLYLLLRSSRSSLRSSALTETGQGCHLEAGPGIFPGYHEHAPHATFKEKYKKNRTKRNPGLAV